MGGGSAPPWTVGRCLRFREELPCKMLRPLFTDNTPLSSSAASRLFIYFKTKREESHDLSFLVYFWKPEPPPLTNCTPHHTHTHKQPHTHQNRDIFAPPAHKAKLATEGPLTHATLKLVFALGHQEKDIFIFGPSISCTVQVASCAQTFLRNQFKDITDRNIYIFIFPTHTSSSSLVSLAFLSPTNTSQANTWKLNLWKDAFNPCKLSCGEYPYH